MRASKLLMRHVEANVLEINCNSEKQSLADGARFLHTQFLSNLILSIEKGKEGEPIDYKEEISGHIIDKRI